MSSFKLSGRPRSYCLAIGGSDACVKLFRVECNEDGAEATITPVGFYRGNRGPIISMKLVTLDVASRMHVLCAGNTAGEVLLFDLSAHDADDAGGVAASFRVEPFARIRAHQSGVNSLDAAPLPGGHALCVFSGGDDQSVHYAEVEVGLGARAGGASGGRVVVGQRCASSTRSHSAAVNGASIVDVGGGDRVFVSASLDQRLNVYRAVRSAAEDGQQPTLGLQLLGSTTLDVSEPSALETCRLSNGRILAAVTGVGLQSLEISAPSGE